MGEFFSMYVGKASLYLVLVVVGLIALAVVARNWSCRSPRQPRPHKIVTAGPYRVLSIPTGASIEVATGRKDKRTRTIRLLYVQAPVSGPDAQAAIDNLRDIAGPEITVQYEKHGLLRGEDKGMASFDKWFEAHYEVCPICSIEPTKENPEPQFCDEAKRRLEEAEDRWLARLEDGGVETADNDAEWETWYAEHVKHCEQCSDVSHGPSPLCKEAFEKWQEIMRKDCIKVECKTCKGTGKIMYPAGTGWPVHENDYEDECYHCGGKGWRWHFPTETERVEAPDESEAFARAVLGEGAVKIAEARAPTIGIVFGASGINTNLAQVGGGYADTTTNAPDEYQAAKAKAQKLKTGIWQEPGG